MQLVINSYGTYLHVSDGLFEIQLNGEKKRVSPKKIRSICVTTGACMSTDAVKLAVENNIDILFLDQSGSPFGRVWHDRLGSTARIRRKQLELSSSPQGIEYGKNFVAQKFKNQIEFLEQLRKRRTRASAEITSAIQRITEALKRLNNLDTNSDNTSRETIMGIEGSSARNYWDTLSALLPWQFQFNGRSRNPAKDEFNCLLNYAYGVLYGTVERSCVLAGIDPYLGFIHTDNYAKTSMVFDVIEGYRIYAEITVFNLFSGKKVTGTMFDKQNHGFTLNKEGKQVLISELNTYLNETILYNGRKIKRRDIIQFDLHKMANEWIKSYEAE